MDGRRRRRRVSTARRKECGGTAAEVSGGGGQQSIESSSLLLRDHVVTIGPAEIRTFNVTFAYRSKAGEVDRAMRRFRNMK